jgi:hypothetical protein
MLLGVAGTSHSMPFTLVVKLGESETLKSASVALNRGEEDGYGIPSQISEDKSQKEEFHLFSENHKAWLFAYDAGGRSPVGIDNQAMAFKVF